MMTDKDREFLESYFSIYRRLLIDTDVSAELLAFCNLCLEVKARRNKLIFAGNGASASISSHAATDFTQHANVRAVAFNDHNLITAFGNDYGYENWVARALEAYADPGDVVVLISSSGASPNVVNAAKYARAHNLRCVTFTGFAPDNPLRSLGDPNLWLDCHAYNIVESTHLIWILSVARLLESEVGDGRFLRTQFSEIYGALSDQRQRIELTRFRDLCREVVGRSGKLIFAGNGGSASIASHAAADFTKQSRVRSVAFNDCNMLTAFANDYGQEHWIERCIAFYADPEDAVILISSSGRSANMINAASFALNKDLPVVTFTGFDSRNSLQKLGYINFWADGHYNSIADGLHSAWIFCVADLLVGQPIS